MEETKRWSIRTRKAGRLYSLVFDGKTVIAWAYSKPGIEEACDALNELDEVKAALATLGEAMKLYVQSNRRVDPTETLEQRQARSDQFNYAEGKVREAPEPIFKLAERYAKEQGESR